MAGFFCFDALRKSIKVRWGKEKWWPEAVMEKGTDLLIDAGFVPLV
jgi:hypothetical protein